MGRVAQSVQRLSYGLDGPRSNPGGDEIFRLSRPALGPTQPPVKLLPCLSREESAAGACFWPLTPSSSAAVMEELSYTSTHPLGHTGSVTIKLYLTLLFNITSVIPYWADPTLCFNDICIVLFVRDVFLYEYSYSINKSRQFRVVL